MKKNKVTMFYICLLQMLLALTGCVKKNNQQDSGSSACIYNGVDTCLQKPAQQLIVSLNDEKQTIHSFGASDCWTTKFYGKWSDMTKRNQIADYLFSMDNDANGNPKGIGLSLWRFNIGGGTYEMGTASGIATDWRREECFLKPDGTYDWTKQAGQRWFVQAAKQRGVKYLLGFNILPPVQWTITGDGNSKKMSVLNLKQDKYDAFAGFLADVANNFQQAGTPMDYISPFNEPQWEWGNDAGAAGQEGTAATNAEIASVVRLLGPKLAAKSLSTKIALGEAGTWDYLTKSVSGNAARSDQIADWFSASSPDYVGNVPNMEKLISAHSYFTTCPDNTMVSSRQDVAFRRNQVDGSLQLWQTEFGILNNICNLYNGAPRNTTIDYGLYVAKTIHHDLAIAGVTSWQWWLAVSPYDYSDALVYVNDPSGKINVDGTKTDGLVNDSKQLWCFGNYSRFVRPGMKRVTATIGGVTDAIIAAGSQMVTAYKDAANKKIVIVIVNMAGEKKITIGGNSGLTIVNNTLDKYTTSANKSLQKSVTGTSEIVLDAKSVTTLVGTYQ